MSKTWVCLRGLGRGNFHWGEFRALMEKQFPEDKFIWLEFPGNGERYQEKSPWTVNGYIKDIRWQLRDVLPQGPVNVLALSFGAMVAVKWAEMFPQEVARATLINTSHAEQIFFKRLRPEAIKYLLSIFFFSLEKIIEQVTKDFHQGKMKASRQIESQILKMTVNSEAVIDKNLSSWAQFAESHPVTLLNFIAQLWSAAHTLFPLKAPTKIQLVTSQGDRMVSSECSWELSKIWSAPILELAKSGHDIPLEDPQALLQVLYS